jgi:NTE family protein
MMREKIQVRQALQRLLHKLPQELRNDSDARLLAELKGEPEVSIVHLIYRARAYESHARDYEFSRISVEEHWDQGRKDVVATLRRREWKERRDKPSGLQVFDLSGG